MSNIYRNPLSKNVRKNPTVQRSPINLERIFVGEVLYVEHIGMTAGYISYAWRGSVGGDPVQNAANIGDIGSKSANIAQPLLANIKLYPVVGEQVLLFNFGNVYYLPLNVLNNPVMNQAAISFRGNAKNRLDESGKTDSNKKNTFTINPDTVYRITNVEPGDIVLEGRAGNSIKFCSTVKKTTGQVNTYSRSDLSNNGDPIMIIRNAPGGAGENIQADGASIYLCSTQKIFVDDGKSGFDGITGTWSTLNVSGETIQTTELQLTPGELRTMTIMRDDARNKASQLKASGDMEGAATATERSRYLESQIASGEAASTTVLDAEPAPIDPNITDFCKKIIAYAQADAAVPIVETPPGSNYSTRINEMVRMCGLNNETKYNNTGEGYYWCAAAVTAWFKAAGADTPPGPASCDSWMSWAKKNGTFSPNPVPGAAILYGSSVDSNHIGIVERIAADGTVYSIEGNTSGGSGFNRNGGGVYRKKPSLKRIAGYVLPSRKGKLAPCVKQPSNMTA